MASRQRRTQPAAWPPLCSSAQHAHSPSHAACFPTPNCSQPTHTLLTSSEAAPRAREYSQSRSAAACTRATCRSTSSSSSSSRSHSRSHSSPSPPCAITLCPAPYAALRCAKSAMRLSMSAARSGRCRCRCCSATTTLSGAGVLADPYSSSSPSCSGCSQCSGAPCEAANSSPWWAHSSTPCSVAATVLAIAHCSTSRLVSGRAAAAALAAETAAELPPRAAATAAATAVARIFSPMSSVAMVRRVWPRPSLRSRPAACKGQPEECDEKGGQHVCAQRGKLQQQRTSML